MRKTFFIGTLSLFLLGACNSQHHEEHDEHDHATEQHDHAAEGAGHEGHNHETETHESGNEIVLTPEKAKAAGVVVNEIQPGTFHQVIKTSGQVLAAQGDERMAVATVAGVVSFKNQVIEGMSVGQGMPLVVLSSRHMAEGDPVQKARVAYEVAKKEYERMAALVGDKIVSEKEFAQAQQTYENARISYEAVAKNQTENEKYYKDLGSIVSAHFRTPYNDEVYDLKKLNGRLLSYGKASGEQGYYIPVTFEFDNRGGVVPGSFVEIFLLSQSMEGVLAVPESALTEEQGSFFVYRQVDEECYEKQRVIVGADDGEQVQILSGIRAGDRIVTQGAYQVKLASASNAIPAHTHEH